MLISNSWLCSLSGLLFVCHMYMYDHLIKAIDRLCDLSISLYAKKKIQAESIIHRINKGIYYI